MWSARIITPASPPTRVVHPGRSTARRTTTRAVSQIRAWTPARCIESGSVAWTTMHATAAAASGALQACAHAGRVDSCGVGRGALLGLVQMSNRIAEQPLEVLDARAHERDVVGVGHQQPTAGGTQTLDDRAVQEPPHVRLAADEGVQESTFPVDGEPGFTDDLAPAAGGREALRRGGTPQPATAPMTHGFGRQPVRHGFAMTADPAFARTVDVRAYGVAAPAPDVGRRSPGGEASLLERAGSGADPTVGARGARRASVPVALSESRRAGAGVERGTRPGRQFGEMPEEQQNGPRSADVSPSEAQAARAVRSPFQGPGAVPHSPPAATLPLERRRNSTFPEPPGLRRIDRLRRPATAGTLGGSYPIEEANQRTGSDPRRRASALKRPTAVR